ncbi:MULTISPECIES: ABC transporter ATP-binding protein [unclassified Microbacterium]|uniref:ABC transporter ATP-binding protein n=1 Tax=unclassified Microbacterium TaxID=2609290 RepID=UPI001D25CA5B|nr:MULTISPECIES: ABC transporter ATP-binding protein [unclassified Microbacterium]CAH0123371.1 Daunorubicin/doxorubicin resistance ATP-binding protein DrrA [Microbacterium sp. Bi121]HWK76793.1 ABC transporter ATP-binding protein [Microbacterium sp.]
MTDTIEVSALHKRYGHNVALHELDLRVRPGTVFGLIGPNGAGKTTTLRTLLDIIRPSSGTVRVLGEDPRRGGPALRRRIGYVPGELHLEGRASGHRLLAFYAEVSGSTGSSGPVLGTARDLADRLGVDLNRPVRTLSKGNKQKVGLIQAFMHRPELLILDEPTSGLDPLMQREFLAMVREARDAGQTVLLSSHVLSEIQQTADEVAVLAAGRIVADGDVASLRLGSVRRIRVRIGGADAAAAHAAFERIPGIAGVDASSAADASGGVQVAATIEGAIDPFVKALAQYEVQDLTVEEPDLEESVLRLYGNPSPASATAPTSAPTRRPRRSRGRDGREGDRG